MTLAPEHLPAWIVLTFGVPYLVGTGLLALIGLKIAWRVLRVVRWSGPWDPVMDAFAVHRREVRALYRTDRDLRVLALAVMLIAGSHAALVAFGHTFAPG